MPTSFPAELLLITDGTTTFDLMNRGTAGFWCYNWVPAVAEPKGGGSFRDSPLAEGRTPAYRQFGNVIDSFDISATGLTQDVLARDIGKLRYLLENAVKYWVSNQPNKYTWLVARGVGETNTRYATVIDYRTPSDGNPYDDPLAKLFSPRSAIDPWTLIIEHDQWSENPPGIGTCVEVSAQQEDWHYEPDWTLHSAQPVTHCRVVYGSEECDYLFAGDTGNVWRTTNLAAPWVASVTVPNDLDVYSMVRMPQSGHLFASGYSAGGANGRTDVSTDCGGTWAEYIAGTPRGTRSYGTLCAGGDGLVYLATGDTLGVPALLSSDPIAGVPAWATAISSGGWDQVRCIVELDSDAAVPGRMILGVENTVGAGEIWITDDYWTTSQCVFVLENYYPTYLFVTAEGLILMGVTSGSIFSSIDGTVWEERASGFGGSILGIDQDTESVVKATFVEAGGVASTARVRVSGDGGHTWDTERTITTTRDHSYGLFYSSFLPTTGQWFATVNDLALANPEIFALDNITTVGRAATCDDEGFIVNHRSELNLTHVKVYDLSAAPPADYTDEFPAAAFSFDLLPPTPGGAAVGDAVYFGIDTDLQANGDPPFDNLVFDIDTPAYDQSLRWEYWNNAWTTLTTHDGTNAGMGPLTRSGVNSVSWGPPTDWVTTTIDGITALWVRCYVYGAPGADEVTPTQQNRDVYTTIWPRIDIAAAQVPGTIMALARHKLTMRSDEDGVGGDAPNLFSSRVMMGLRSIERGGIDCSDFTAYLNCSDEQNPPGIRCVTGTSTSFADYLDHATGRVAVYYPLGVQPMAMRVRFELAGEFARQYYGSYRIFARVRQENSDLGAITLRLYVGSPWGADEYWTSIKTVPETQSYTKLIDFGEVTLPLTRILRPAEYPGPTRLEIHAACPDSTATVVHSLGSWMSSRILAPYDTAIETAVNPTDLSHWTTAQLSYDGLTAFADSPALYILDLILMPTDEWYGDFVDDVLSTTTALQQGYYFDLDSIQNPRERQRPLVINAATGAVMTVYEPQSPGPALLNPQKQQRMWYLFDKSNVTGTGDWDASAHILVSARAERMARYLGMRGDR